MTSVVKRPRKLLAQKGRFACYEPDLLVQELGAVCVTGRGAVRYLPLKAPGLPGVVSLGHVGRSLLMLDLILMNLEFVADLG